MRVVLLGAVDSTRVALEALAAADLAPAALLTLPLARAARHSDYVDLRPLAGTLGVPVIEITDVNAPPTLSEVRVVSPDMVWVVGWSQICRSELLGIARRGTIGYHPAPLPENRGRAVIPWTILQGRPESGSTLFWMDEGMDSGDILAQERFPVAPNETAASLYDKHMVALRRMIDDVAPRLARGEVPRRAQDHAAASYCAKRTPADGLIDWGNAASRVWTLIRASGRPYPGAFTYHGTRRLIIWRASHVGSAPYHGIPGQVQEMRGDGTVLVQCGDGEHLLIEDVQADGGSPARPGDVLRIHDKLGIDLGELMRRLAGGGAT
jgi:methionyl-tRNA formyltransferase